MGKKGESLTGDEFFEFLHHDNLSAAVPVTLTGMVKKSESKEKTIQFALGANCSNWTTIPLEFIDDVAIIKSAPCDDHSHIFVRLTLKTAKTIEAKVFCSILQATLSSLEEMQLTFAARQAVDGWGDPVCGPGTKKRCDPARCPNPSGHGTIWCTKCRCLPVFNPNPEGFASYYPF